jgi:hypothetical protein
MPQTVSLRGRDAAALAHLHQDRVGTESDAAESHRRTGARLHQKAPT